jgi:hypothetical protein
MLAAERDAHSHAWLCATDGIALREVIEEPPQRRIERNAQDGRVRQNVTSRVFHNACG